MRITRWLLACLILFSVSVFADTIPGDPQVDPLPCDGSTPLTLGAGGSLIAHGTDGTTSTTLFATTAGSTFCYSNRTGSPLGGISITAHSFDIAKIDPHLFVCPTDSPLFTLCSTSIVGDTATFTFLQGNGRGVPGCTNSELAIATVCGEFEFTAVGFSPNTTFTANSVPEGSTLAMLLPGLAYVGNKIRRRRRK